MFLKEFISTKYKDEDIEAIYNEMKDVVIFDEGNEALDYALNNNNDYVYFIEFNNQSKFFVANTNQGIILKNLGCKSYFTKQLNRLTNNCGPFRKVSQEDALITDIMIKIKELESKMEAADE